jgi:hypothetical protein
MFAANKLPLRTALCSQQPPTQIPTNKLDTLALELRQRILDFVPAQDLLNCNFTKPFHEALADPGYRQERFGTGLRRALTDMARLADKRVAWTEANPLVLDAPEHVARADTFLRVSERGMASAQDETELTFWDLLADIPKACRPADHHDSEAITQNNASAPTTRNYINHDLIAYTYRYESHIAGTYVGLVDPLAARSASSSCPSMPPRLLAPPGLRRGPRCGRAPEPWVTIDTGDTGFVGVCMRQLDTWHDVTFPVSAKSDVLSLFLTNNGFYAVGRTHKEILFWRLDRPQKQPLAWNAPSGGFQFLPVPPQKSSRHLLLPFTRSDASNPQMLADEMRAQFGSTANLTPNTHDRLATPRLASSGVMLLDVGHKKAPRYVGALFCDAQLSDLCFVPRQTGQSAFTDLDVFVSFQAAAQSFVWAPGLRDAPFPLVVSGQEKTHRTNFCTFDRGSSRRAVTHVTDRENNKNFAQAWTLTPDGAATLGEPYSFDGSIFDWQVMRPHLNGKDFWLL